MPGRSVLMPDAQDGDALCSDSLQKICLYKDYIAAHELQIRSGDAEADYMQPSQLSQHVTQSDRN